MLFGRSEADLPRALAGENILDVVLRVKVNRLQVQVLPLMILDDLVPQLAILQ